MYRKILFILFLISTRVLLAQDPVAHNDVDTADQDTTLSVPAPGLLDNDEGTGLQVTSFSVNGNTYTPGSTATIPGVGSITIQADGSWEFIPATGYFGPVPEITYTINNISSALLLLTVETNGDLLKIDYLTSCNQGYTVDGYYKIRYYLRLTNTSIALDYHPNSLIHDIDLHIDLESTFGNSCVAGLEEFSVSENVPDDYVDNPYPTDFTSSSLNPNFENITSTAVFTPNAVNNNILYPRQSIYVQLCVLVEPFCNGRPNPTPSGSGITFDLTATATSSRGNDSFTYDNLQDFHTTEAIVSANIFLTEVIAGNVADPVIEPNGTFDYTFEVTLNNEGATAAQDVNFNLGLGNMLNGGIIFSTLDITQVNGPSLNINPAYDGDTETLILTPGNVLPANNSATFSVHFITNQIPSSDTVYYFSSPGVSMTLGPDDSASGFDETSATNKRVYSYVLWSDGLGNHIDRYYKAVNQGDLPSSNDQCECANVGIRFMYEFNFDLTKTAEVIDEAPNGIPEWEEVLFTLEMSNHSPSLQIINLQLEDVLSNICGGQIISVSSPQIVSSSATQNPNLNPSFDGVTDTLIFDGSSGILDPEPDDSLPDQSITVQFTVVFTEDCIGENIATFSASDPANYSSGSVNSNPVSINVFTDTDNDGIHNVTDIDDDNDGIPDITESNSLDPLNDTDGDFIPDYRDTDFGPDDNGDGIIDIFDFDADGVPNHFDLDSDNDGIADLTEAGNSNIDTDDDAMTNNNVGSNGLDDTLEDNDTTSASIVYTIPNNDTDTNLNYLDIDSDADGIPDIIEGQSSLGYSPPLTPDTSGMVYDTPLLPEDTDADNIPDYLDDNSDNDIRPDVLEGWDTDSNGIAETLPTGTDADNDGLDDAFDNDDNAVNPTNGQIPQNFPNMDNPSTPELDWRELYEVQVVVNNDQNVEGNTLHFTFSLQDRNGHPITSANAATSASTTDINIDVSTADGGNGASPEFTAQAPYDYTPVPANTSLTIPAGEVSVDIDVDTYDDIIYENDELMSIIGDITSGNTLNTNTTGIGTIIDDEEAPTLTVNDDIKNEGETLQHTFTISGPCSTPVNILVNTEDVTAQHPDDYNAITGSTLVIPATSDETNPQLETTANILAIEDNVDEPDEEYYLIKGQVMSNNTANTNVAATGTIIDMDPDPELFISNSEVTEGDTLQFIISLSNLTTQDINLEISTLDGTAQAPGDYQYLSYPGIVPALTDSLSVEVPTIDDRINESTEYMTLHIMVTSANTQNSTAEGTGTIKDNDTPNLFSPNNDGNSDLFVINGLEDYPDFSLEIFDRWGSKVYEYHNNGELSPEWWDGTHNGKPVPVGVYYYVLRFNDGHTEPKLGFVELIR